MAKTIKDAVIVVTNTSSGVANVVHATVVMPVSEFAAFQALGDLTDAVPAATTTFILRTGTGDTGPAQ